MLMTSIHIYFSLRDRIKQIVQKLLVVQGEQRGVQGEQRGVQGEQRGVQGEQRGVQGEQRGVRTFDIVLLKTEALNNKNNL